MHTLEHVHLTVIIHTPATSVVGILYTCMCTCTFQCGSAYHLQYTCWDICTPWYMYIPTVITCYLSILHVHDIIGVLLYILQLHVPPCYHYPLLHTVLFSCILQLHVQSLPVTVLFSCILQLSHTCWLRSVVTLYSVTFVSF